jgi:hypothetical protein
VYGIYENHAIKGVCQMENVQFWTIIGLIIASFVTLASVMIFMIDKLDEDIQSISKETQIIYQVYRLLGDLLKERK